MQGTRFIPAGQIPVATMRFIPNPNYRHPKGRPYPVKFPPEYELDDEGRARLKKEFRASYIDEQKRAQELAAKKAKKEAAPREA